jgi:hypothetical protein
VVEAATGVAGMSRATTAERARCATTWDGDLARHRASSWT